VKNPVFLAFLGVQQLAEMLQKHVIYGKNCEKGSIQNFKNTFFTAKIGILKMRLRQNMRILR